MRPPTDADTRERILFLLKTRGPRDAAVLAARLGLSAIGVRRHLAALAEEGLVAAREEHRPRGRPARVWSLTENGAARFPEGYADLTVELLGAMRAAFGDEGLERLVAERSRRQLAAYRRDLPARDEPLERRVAALARQRREEGYLAEWRRERDGTLLLVENHCPICAAAELCQGLCAGELDLFRKYLGRGVRIERTEHVLEGARRCAYRIVKS